MLATDYEEVRYEYTGSTEDLQRATNRAIRLLERAQYHMEAISKQSIKPDTTGLNGLKQQINQLMSEASKLQERLTSMTQPGTATKQAVEAAKELHQAVRSLCNVYVDFTDINEQTTSQVRDMASAMRQVASAFRRVQQAAADDDTSRALSVFTGTSARDSQALSVFTGISTRDSQVLPAVAAGGGGGGGGNALTGAIGAIGGDPGGAIGALPGASAFAGLSQILAIIRDIINAIKLLIDLYKKVDNAWKKFIQWQIDQLNKLLGVILTVINVVRDGLDVFTSGLKNATILIENLTTGFGLLSSAAETVLGAFESIVGVGIGISLAEAVKQSIDYSENLNLLQVALKDSADAGMQFVSTLQEIYGLDPTNIMSSVGYFYQMSDAVGTSTKAAETMSMGLTKAAADISSLFNVDVGTVQSNLASGMQGMSRAVRKYGMDIRAVTLKQTAMSLGIQGSTATMNEATLQGLRYVTMMRQARNAMNDFGNTIESPANQLKIFKEQISQLGRAIGNFFIPILQKVLPLLNGIAMAIRVILTFLGTLFGLDIGSFNSSLTAGVDAANDEADALAGVGSAAASTKKELDNLLAPFDELNILQKQAAKKGGSSGGGGISGAEMDPRLLAEIEKLSASFTDVRMKANEVRDAILEVFGLSWDGSTISITTDGFIDKLIKLWRSADFEGFGTEIASFFNRGIQWGLDHTDPSKYIEKITQVVTTITDILRGLIGNIDWNGIGNTIGNLWSNALTAISVAVDTFPWAEIGSALYGYVEDLVGNIPWSTIIDTLFNGLAGLNAAALSFVTQIKWQEIEDQVVESVNRIINRASELVQDLGWWRTLAKNLGVLISRCIRQIDWAKATSTVCQFILNIAHSVLDFIQAIDWQGVVHALSDIVNTLVQEVKGFVEAIDWMQAGVEIAKFVNEMFKKIDWKEAGETLSKIITGFLDMCWTAFLGADWDAIFEDIKQFLEGLDWGEIMLKLVNLLMEAFKLKWSLRWSVLGEFISSYFKELWETIVYTFTGGAVAGNPNAGSSSGMRGGRGSGAVGHFATGGVVTQPTMALIGEGKYSEAVIPLGNSPQMSQLLNQFAQIASQQGSGAPEVNVYIGQEKFDAYTYKASTRGKKLVGKQPIKLGG